MQQGNLILNPNKGNPKLKDLYIRPSITQRRSPVCMLRLVYTSDGIGIGRILTIMCKSKNGVVRGIGSVTESESEGSEGFLVLPIPLPIPSLLIMCKLVKRRAQNNFQKFTGQDDRSNTF